MKLYIIIFSSFVLLTSCKKTEVAPSMIGKYPYIHHVKNNGVKPGPGSIISYHQTIQVGDSVIFSTYDVGKPKDALMPARDKYPDPPPPDYIALMKMSAGDSLTIYQPIASIPSTLLKKNKGLNANDTIVHHLKMMSVKTAEEIADEVKNVKARQPIVQKELESYIDKYKSGKLKSELTNTSSGLSYMILKAKPNGATPSKGQYIRVHYQGALQKDKTPIDNTFMDGRPYPYKFGTGAVIKGMDEGIGLMKEGETAVFFIPYSIAYGADGRAPAVPAKADLAFYVELSEVINK